MELQESVDIIPISAVLHQWGWDEQIESATKLVAFTKPGILVVGHRIGHIELTGTKWKTEACSGTFEHIGWESKDRAWMEPGEIGIAFMVTRIG